MLHYVGTFSHQSETFIYDLLHALNEGGQCEQSVFCHTLINEETRHFDPVYEFPMKRSWLRRLKWKFNIGKWNYQKDDRFKKHYDSVRPDIVHAHFGSNGVRMGDFLRKHDPRCPLLIHCHGTDVLSLPFRDKVYREHLLALAKDANVFYLSNTQFLKDHMVTLGLPEEKIFISQNAVSPGFVQPQDVKCRDLVSEEATFRILSVGRLIRWKGHRYLIEAIALYQKQNRRPVELTIVGEGDERNHLTQLVEDLGLQGQVEFKGLMSHEDVARQMAEHDLFIQPSIVDPDTRQCESFGMTVLEAIASGLPVIVTETGGMPELLGGASDWAKVVPPADPTALMEAIDAFMMATAKGWNNHQYATGRVDNYSQERQVSRLLDLYAHCAESVKDAPK